MSSQPTEDKDKLGMPPMPQMPQMASKGVPLFDRFGNKFFVGVAGDLWVPPFAVPEHVDYRMVVRGIRDMEVREDDVLVCSYPKTGTHWTTAIISMLMSGHISHEPVRGRGLLEMSPLPLVNQLESPRMLNTHLPYRYIPQQAIKKKVKVVLLNRNPKDTIVSYYHHLIKHKQPLAWEGTFEHFFHFVMEIGGLYGDVLDYYMQWQDAMDSNPDAQIHMSMFEDMKVDPVGGVVKLNEFLETGRSLEYCQEVARECQFDTLKAAREEVTPDFVKNLFKDGKPAFFRKGDVGDWKNHFTVAMNEQFEDIYKRRMNKYRTTYKYTL